MNYPDLCRRAANNLGDWPNTADGWQYEDAARFRTLAELLERLWSGPFFNDEGDDGDVDMTVVRQLSASLSNPKVRPPIQEGLSRIRRLLQIPQSELAVLYTEDALENHRIIPSDDSEIEMLRHLIHVELDRLTAPLEKGKPYPDPPPTVRPRPTLAELEAILEGKDDVSIEILPNGELRAKADPKDTSGPFTTDHPLSDP